MHRVNTVENARVQNEELYCECFEEFYYQGDDDQGICLCICHEDWSLSYYENRIEGEPEVKVEQIKNIIA